MLNWAESKGIEAQEVGGKEHGGMVRLHITLDRAAAAATVPTANEATMIRKVFGTR